MLTKLLDNIDEIFLSAYPFKALFEEITQAILFIWNYKLFETADKHPIMVGNLVLAIILFFVGTKVAKKLSLSFKNKLSNRPIDPNMASLLERLVYYFLIILATIFVLDISNVPLTAFTVIGTTLALGIGLGSQNIANNFISGIIIMIERPIKLGDTIEVDHIVGKVTNIGARCISIQTDKNINMLIPNSYILQNAVINWTLEDSTLKYTLNLSIDEQTSLDILDQIILQTLKENIYVLTNPKPEILVKQICKNGYEIEVELWLDILSNKKAKYVINDLYRALILTFKENNIQMLDKKEHSPNP
jgi:potassium efflux system protein